ncbi:MAG: GTP cyclohydrolase II [Candidatus Devosia euplotis]|nr:GTP cyclohydrolase II [Candidatus Devosia euplotis]
MPILTIAEFAAHRYQAERLVEQVTVTDLPSSLSGEATRVHAFRSLLDGAEHLAVVNTPISGVPPVRVHSECMTGDALGSLRCDCGRQLQQSLQMIGKSGGAPIYLRGQEGRGIGLANKIRTYVLQDGGRDTMQANTDLGFAADARDYAIAAQILRTLEIETITLLTSNPAKAEALQANGITVQKQRSLIIQPNRFNLRYLDTKRDKFGHALTHHS